MRILMGILMGILIGILMMDSMGWPYDSSDCLLYYLLWQVGWLGCVVKCPIEQFLNRAKFDR